MQLLQTRTSAPHPHQGPPGRALHLSSMFSQELSGTPSRILMLLLQHRKSFLGPHTQAGRKRSAGPPSTPRLMAPGFLLTGKVLFSRPLLSTLSLLQPRRLHKAAQTFLLSSPHLQGPALTQGETHSQLRLLHCPRPVSGPGRHRTGGKGGKGEGLQLQQRPMLVAEPCVRRLVAPPPRPPWTYCQENVLPCSSVPEVSVSSFHSVIPSCRTCYDFIQFCRQILKRHLEK